MPRHTRVITGVVILTRTKEELKDALEALTEAAETELHPQPPRRIPRLRLAAPRERVA